jgi:hypothetical protein
MIFRPEQFRWFRSLVTALSLNIVLSFPLVSSADQTPVVPFAPDYSPPPVSDQTQSPATLGPIQHAEPALPTEPALAPEFAPPAESASTSYVQTLERTMDEAHASIERNILHQAVRLDNFFGYERGNNQRPTKYELRWRNSLRVDHAWSFTPGTTIQAHLTLSKISDRLRIVIAGENEKNQPSQTLPKDPGSPGFDRTTPTAHFANTELRYELVRTPSVNVFLGAGVRIAIPFEAFVRSRFQYTHPLNDITLMRVAETFFVKNSDLLGETTEFSLEWSFGKHTILRWANAGTASEEIEGVEWGTELSLLQELSPKSAITLTGGIYGDSSVNGPVTNFRLLARYRRNFLRDWLFFELEPEVSWPRETSGSFPATYAFTFYLEVVFKGATDSSNSAAGNHSPGKPSRTSGK